MPRRSLPTPAEAAAILARKRTRPTRRPPPPLGRSLNKTLKALDERFGQGPGALQARWREIVGAEIAKRTEPVKLTKPRDGGPASLEIRVAGPAAALIQHQAPEIVARVNLFLGAGAVNKLRIVQGPLRALGETTKPVRRKSAPLDAAQEADLARSLAEAPDGPLKAALLRLGRGVLRDRRSR
ncbi:MAG TPA: DciA family protein [Phenylobacterium sp.]|nr:DciA family protein [Phenylobacterium sp.]